MCAHRESAVLKSQKCNPWHFVYSVEALRTQIGVIVIQSCVLNSMDIEGISFQSISIIRLAHPENIPPWSIFDKTRNIELNAEKSHCKNSRVQIRRLLLFSVLLSHCICEQKTNWWQLCCCDKGSPTGSTKDWCNQMSVFLGFHWKNKWGTRSKEVLILIPWFQHDYTREKLTNIQEIFMTDKKNVFIILSKIHSIHFNVNKHS